MEDRRLLASDLFAAAIVLTGTSDSDTGSNVGFTGEAGEPNHAGSSSPIQSAWWQWTAPISGLVTIQTCGSNFDTTLGVYTGGAVNSLTEVASNDNASGCGGGSRVGLIASAGTDYKIAVDGSGGDSGNISLSLSMPVMPVIELSGDSGDNTLTVNAGGPDFGTYQLDGGPLVSFVGNDRFVFNGLGGNDRLIINNPAASLFAPEDGIFYDGGGQSLDVLQNLGGTASGGNYSVGSTPDSGRIEHFEGPLAQFITFNGLAPAIDTVAEGSFSIVASPADNAISYRQGSLGRGAVTIDNFELVQFENKTSLSILGLGGSDEISLNNASTPTGLTSIGVVGGDPTAGSDTLIVNFPSGDPNFRPTDDGAGTIAIGALPDVTFFEIEQVKLRGLNPGANGLNYLPPSGVGADTYEYTPGINADEGRVTGFRAGAAGFNFTPLDFVGLRTFVQVQSGDPSDTVIANGTAVDNVFRVADSVTDPGFLAVTVDGHTQLISTANILGPTLVLRGLGGNDTFDLDFNPVSTIARANAIRVEGGDSDGSSDVLSFTGSGTGAVTVDLAAQTVQEAGFGPVSLAGVETLNVNAGGASAVVVGTSANEQIDVSFDETLGRGTVNSSDSAVTVHVSGSSVFTVNPGAGLDRVTVRGSDANDTISVGLGATSTVAVNGANVVSIPAANTEALVVETGLGNDSVTVGGAAGPPLTVDAGAGNDTVNGVGSAGFTALGGEGNDTLSGGSGNDRLEGGDGEDVINGRAGQNTIFGGGDADIINVTVDLAIDLIEGGASVDTVNFNGDIGIYSVSQFIATQASLSGPSLSAQVFGVEEIFAGSTSFGASELRVDDLTGTDVREVTAFGRRSSLTSTSISGLAGMITVNGTGASDNISVSREVALTDVDMPWGRVKFFGAEGTLVINGDDGDDAIAVAPDAINGTTAIVLNGDFGDDRLASVFAATLSGGIGNDTLEGSAGDDTFNGGEGDDVIIDHGGLANTIVAGAGGDVIQVDGTAGSDNIVLQRSGALGADLDVIVNGVTSTYLDYQGKGLVRVDVNGGGGANFLTVDSTLGGLNLVVDYTGGNSYDGVFFTGGTATSNTFNPGPVPGQGESSINTATGNQTVVFRGVNEILDAVAGPLLVNGTGAGNTINFFSNLISVDDLGAIQISNKTNVSIFAFTGSDTISINGPLGLSGTINVNGGDPTSGSDTVIVNGNAAINNVNIDQLTVDGARVTGLGPVINVATTEHLIYSGNGGNDNLTVTTPANGQVITVTPGAVPGEGSIAIRNFTAIQGNPLLSIDFNDISANGSITFADVSGTRVDSLRLFGTGEANIFRNNAAGLSTLVSLAGGGENVKRIPVATPGVAELNLVGLEGDDSFELVGNHPFTMGLSVDGGDPSASDSLVLTTVTANLDFATNTISNLPGGSGPIGLSGVERVRLDGTVGAGDGFNILNYGLPTDVKLLELFEANQAAIRTGDAPNIAVDTLRFYPFTNRNARMERAEGGPVIDILLLNPDASVELGAATQGADDRLEVIGGHDGDQFRVFRSQPSPGDAVQVDTTLAIGTADQTNGVRIIFQTSVESLALVGRSGADTFVIDEVNGLLGGLSAGAGSSTILRSGIVVEGSDGSDRLEFTGTAAVAATYTAGPIPGEGIVSHSAGGNTQTVHFYGLEPVFDAVPGTLVINGDNGDNAINYSQGSVAANGLLSVDAQETYEFTAKTTLTINGLAGSDTIHLNNSSTPTGLASIAVDGGDPTASDTVIVSGTGAADTINFAPSGAASGTVQVNAQPLVTLTTVEFLTYSGEGGNDSLTVTSPSGTQTFTMTTGLAADSGSIRVSQGGGVTQLPIDYADLGINGSVLLANSGGARSDVLQFFATDQDEVLNVSSTGDIHVVDGALIGAFRTVRVQTPGITEVDLIGLDGDDTFNISGGHPFSRINVEGGNPSASDELNLTAATGPVTIDLNAQTVTGFAGVISLSGIEILNASAGANSVTVVGGVGPDAIRVTPTGANTATISATGLNLTINTNSTGDLNINAGGGSDVLSVVGGQTGETISVTGALVTVSGLKAVNFTNSEALRVFGEAGADTFDVTPSGGIL